MESEYQKIEIGQVFEKPLYVEGGAERVSKHLYDAVEAKAFALSSTIDPEHIEELGTELERKKLGALHSVGEWPEQIRDREEFMKTIAQKEEVSNLDVVIIHNPLAAGVLDFIDPDLSIFYNHSAGRSWTFLLEEIEDVSDPLRNYSREINKKEIRNIFQRQFEKPDIVLSNSKFIESQTEKYFDTESEVIYPGVDREKFRPGGSENKDFFLSVQRIYWEKGIEIQLEAFKQLEEEIVIVGDSGPYSEWDAYLERLAPEAENITFLGNISDEELIEKINQSKALISTALKEDFGLTPIEAMACGTPSIVPDQGGYRETVTEKVGIRFERDVEGLKKAVRNFEESRFDQSEIREESKKFGKERFKQEIRSKIEENL